MEWISKVAVPGTGSGEDGRLAVRQRFKLAHAFLAPLSKLIQWGFATKKKGKTPMGIAMSNVLGGAIEGVYPNQYVNPAKVLLSNGILANPRDPQLHREGEWIVVDYDQRSERLLNGYWDDEVLICAYNVNLRMAGINEQKSIRNDGKVRLKLPAQLKDEPVHLYMITHCRNRKSFSRSLYLGQF